jgi:hypothetical protein
MRSRLLLVVPLLGLAGLAARPAPAAETASARVVRLIERLGSTAFAEREQAGRELEGIGPAALPELRRAVSGDDPEVRRRAESLVRRLEAQELARKLLTPTHVRLVYKDTPLREALEDLERRTGTQYVLNDPDGRLAERRVSLDTGDTTVWEAVDQFCRRAGLAESAPSAGGGVPMSRRGIPVAPGGMPPVQVQQVQVNGALVTRTFAVHTTPTGPVNLVDGKGQAPPTHYAGAVRVRALPPDSPGAAAVARHAGDLAVALEATPEPHLAWVGAVSVHVERAVDDAGQQLARCWSEGEPTLNQLPVNVRVASRMPARPAMTAETLSLAFKKGDSPSKLLKELSGSIVAQVQTEAEPLITVEKVLQAAGQTFRGSEGGSIKVLQAGNVQNGLTLIHVQVENPPDITVATLPARARLGRGGAAVPTQVAGYNGLHLFDDKDNPIQMFPMRTQAAATPAGIVWDYTFAYQANAGTGEPAKLVFAGSRTVTISIPFTLTDVPLR